MDDLKLNALLASVPQPEVPAGADGRMMAAWREKHAKRTPWWRARISVPVPVAAALAVAVLALFWMRPAPPPVIERVPVVREVTREVPVLRERTVVRRVFVRVPAEQPRVAQLRPVRRPVLRVIAPEGGE